MIVAQIALVLPPWYDVCGNDSAGLPFFGFAIISGSGDRANWVLIFGSFTNCWSYLPCWRMYHTKVRWDFVCAYMLREICNFYVVLLFCIFFGFVIKRFFYTLFLISKRKLWELYQHYPIILLNDSSRLWHEDDNRYIQQCVRVICMVVFCKFSF